MLLLMSEVPLSVCRLISQSTMGLKFKFFLEMTSDIPKLTYCGHMTKSRKLLWGVNVK